MNDWAWDEFEFVLGRDLIPYFPCCECESECVSQLLNDELTSIYIFPTDNRHTKFISNPKSTVRQFQMQRNFVLNTATIISDMNIHIREYDMCSNRI